MTVKAEYLFGAAQAITRALLLGHLLAACPFLRTFYKLEEGVITSIRAVRTRSNGLLMPIPNSVKPTITSAHHARTHPRRRDTANQFFHTRLLLFGALHREPSQSTTIKPILGDPAKNYPQSAIPKFIHVWKHWPEAPPGLQQGRRH